MTDLGHLVSDPARPTPWERGPGRDAYRAELADVDAALAALAWEVARRIRPATVGMLDGDPDRREAVAVWYGTVDRRCDELEDDCFVLVARQAPVAADLREIFAVMRSVHEVRRAGKLLRHITETLGEIPIADLPEHLRVALLVLGEGAERLLEAGVTAWRERDGLAVNELEELDDEVDRLQEGLVADLRVSDHDPEIVARIPLLARWYERIADHGVEIARHVSWAVTGDRTERDVWE